VNGCGSCADGQTRCVSQGRPEAWVSVRQAYDARDAATAGAGSRSGRTTNQRRPHGRLLAGGSGDDDARGAVRLAALGPSGLTPEALAAHGHSSYACSLYTASTLLPSGSSTNAQ
jgi:hypothetical protein